MYKGHVCSRGGEGELGSELKLGNNSGYYPHFLWFGLFRQRFFNSYRVSQKNAPLWVCLISLARNILEGWYIFHFKGGIHGSIWSTKTFLYDIREPRYKRNNMEYHISKFLNIEQSSVLKTDTQYCFPYISVLPCCAELGLNLKNAYGCYL